MQDHAATIEDCLQPLQTAGAVGKRFKRVRKSRGETQTVFAERAGMTQSCYAQYEAGIRTPSIAHATKLRETYGLTLDFIYLGDTSGLTVRLADAIERTNA